MFYRSFLPQRRAFCSHHEIPPRRPQTSISVFPWELPPGARGQTVASCQPRNVTSPQTHMHTPTHSVSSTHSPAVAALLLNTRQFSLHLHWLLRRARTQREKTCVRVCVTLACIWMNVAACGNFECVMKCVMCLHIAAQAHCWLGSLEACLTQLRGTERKVIIS